MDEQRATGFAEEWIDAWNRHDLDAIIGHYAADVEFTSPFVQNLLGDPAGRIRGRDALKEYFRKGLQAYPNLRFDLRHTLAGVGSVTLVYQSVNGLLAAEVMVFDADGLVRTVRAHYGKG